MDRPGLLAVGLSQATVPFLSFLVSTKVSCLKGLLLFALRGTQESDSSEDLLKTLDPG